MLRTERLVLIVDDSPEDRETVRRSLRRDLRVDYRFLEEANGRDGLRTCREATFDCLLLDYDLPDLNGLQFLDELTDGTGRSPLPVVMLTGRGGESVAVEALKRGAQDYLVKGNYSRESLGRSIDDAIERVAIRQELDRQRQELELLYTEARESDRRKDEFLAMLAHELRNPLAPILNAVHVMKNGHYDPADHRRMCEMVERQVRHLCRLVDDLLDVSRITRGKIQLRPERIDLTTVVKLAVENTRVAIEERRQRLTVKLPDATVRIEADPTRVEQVLANLLGNASKYTDAGGSIVLEVEPHEDQVAITVKDNGIGIAPEMLPRVFDLFTQADHSLARSQGGLGIGLTLVKNLVDLHEGSVEARSKGLGLGSEFLVRLPSSRGDVETRDASIETENSLHGGSLRVLIVDDNVHAAESLAMVVNLWNHDARVAHDGPSAITEAQSYQPQVVLLDIGLPGMDGYRVASTLRAQPDLQAVAMIAMTGYGRDEDIQKSKSVGFDRHLIKPIDFAELQSILDGIVGRK